MTFQENLSWPGIIDARARYRAAARRLRNTGLDGTMEIQRVWNVKTNVTGATGTI